MTREEELDWLCRLRSEIYVYMPKEWLIPMNNALDMAIKALVEQESSGDLISKQSVLNACEQSINILEAVDRIMDLPSVKQEPKTEQEDDYFRKIVEVAISQLRADRDRLEDELAKREQEPCDNAVSRQAVLDLIEHYNSDGLGSVFYGYEEGVKFANAVNKLPPVNPQESKTGHWKRISIDKYSEHAMYWYRCDRCGKDNLGNTDWCPNCGTKMVESQESEDKECTKKI